MNNLTTEPDFYASDERKEMVSQLNEREAMIAALKIRVREAEFIISHQQQTMLGMRANLEQLCRQFVEETEKYAPKN